MQEMLQIVQHLGLPVALVVLLIYDWRNRDAALARQNADLALFIRTELVKVHQEETAALVDATAAIKRNTEAFERVSESLEQLVEKRG